MSEPEHGDFVTNKELYEKLGELADRIVPRREVWLIIGANTALVSALTAFITGKTPPAQAAAVAAYAYHVFF